MSHVLNPTRLNPSGLYYLFLAKISREDVFKHLEAGKEKRPQDFPTLDRREVNFWYDSFADGNFDLSQEPTYCQLDNIPVFENITNRLGASDQASLRQVSETARFSIDNRKRLFGKIEFKMNENSIMLSIQSGNRDEDPTAIIETTCTVYLTRDDGCEITKNGEATLSNKTWVEASMSDFKSTIEKINTKVGSLVIKFKKDEVPETNRTLLLNAVTNVMTGLKTKLHIDHLEMDVMNTEDLNVILGAIKPGSLKKVEVDAVNGLDLLHQCGNLWEHWDNLQSFSVYGSPTNLAFSVMGHLKYAFIETIVPVNFQEQELEGYKNRLLGNPQLEKHVIYAPPIQHGRGRLMQAMQPYDRIVSVYSDNTGNEMRGSIAYLEPSRGRLEFDFSQENLMVFTKKD